MVSHPETGSDSPIRSDRDRGRDRRRAVPEETRKPQRSPRSTSARTTTALFTSAVYPSDGHSFSGPARGATRTVPKVVVSDEVRPNQKR